MYNDQIKTGHFAILQSVLHMYNDQIKTGHFAILQM